jgi:hypothetical protein
MADMRLTRDTRTWRASNAYSADRSRSGIPIALRDYRWRRHARSDADLSGQRRELVQIMSGSYPVDLRAAEHKTGRPVTRSLIAYDN